MSKTTKIILILLAALIISSVIYRYKEDQRIENILEKHRKEIMALENLKDKDGYVLSMKVDFSSKPGEKGDKKYSFLWEKTSVSVEMTPDFKTLSDIDKCSVLYDYWDTLRKKIWEAKDEPEYKDLKAHGIFKYKGEKFSILESEYFDFSDDVYNYYIDYYDFEISERTSGRNIRVGAYDFEVEDGKITEFKAKKDTSRASSKSETKTPVKKKYKYSGSKASDPYDAESYVDADDFAEEWEEEFDDYDDAYDYWEDVMD